jgi:hypothetical protein
VGWRDRDFLGRLGFQFFVRKFRKRPWIQIIFPNIITADDGKNQGESKKDKDSLV